MNSDVNLLPNLKERRMVVILEHHSSEVYFKYLWVIILNACLQGTNVTIYDCDWEYFEYSNKDYDQLRKTNISYIRDEFLLALSKFTNGTVQVIRIRAEDIRVNRKDITNINTFSIADNCNPQFGNSLRSVFARDYLSSSNLNLKGKRMHKYFRTQVNSYLSIQALCKLVFANGLYDIILIANGRYPSQTAMRVWAEDHSIDFYCFEHGMPKGESFHFAPFQTQEFAKMQNFIESQVDTQLEKNRQGIISIADEWLTNQASNIKQNPYINQSLKDVNFEKRDSSKPLAVIFNSSIDEKFSNMGVDLNGWDSQKQATLEIARALMNQGYEVLVRIHPNTANKSWWDLINLVNFLKTHKIEYILPWNGPSSYTLLQNAQIVLTWGSTICLEAISRGIPTVVFGRTMYDEIAGAIIVTPTLLKTMDFIEVGLPDPSSGKIASYFNKNWGYKLTDYCNLEDLRVVETILAGNSQDQRIKEIVRLKPSFRKTFTHIYEALVFWAGRMRMGRYSTPNDFQLFLGHFIPTPIVKQSANLVLFLGLKVKRLVIDGEVSI